MLNWFKSTLCESDEEKEFWLSQNMPPSCGHVGHTMVFSLSNAHLGETWSFSMRCSLKDWSLILWKSLLSGQQASSTKESFRAHIWTEGDSGFPPRPPALFCQYSPGGENWDSCHLTRASDCVQAFAWRLVLISTSYSDDHWSSWWVQAGERQAVGLWARSQPGQLTTQRRYFTTRRELRTTATRQSTSEGMLI